MDDLALRGEWGSLWMSRTFSKWILSPNGHPEQVFVRCSEHPNLVENY
jgi:hypothetical protein